MKHFGLDEALRSEIARQLYEAEKSCKPIPNLTTRYPQITLDDAYDIQTRGRQLRLEEGNLIVGRKIGLTSRGMMELLHCDTPDYGYLLNTMLINEGSSCRREELNIPILEGEIAFIMGEDLQGPGVTTADVLNSTAWVVPCFEVCDGRYPDWKVTVRDTISDNAGASHFMLGSKPKRIEDVNLKGIGMVMERNGELIGSAAGAEVMGTPLNSVTWLINKLAEYGDGLKKGDIVLSGAFIAAVPCEKGDYFVMSLDGFPSISLKFT